MPPSAGPTTTFFFVIFLFFLWYEWGYGNKKMWWLYGAVVAGIFLTFSRSALIMLFISAGGYLLSQSKLKNAALFLGMFIFAVFLIISFSTTENTNLLRTASSFSRVESAGQALTIFKSSPLIGVGFNAYRYSLRRLGIEETPTDFENHANSTTDASLLFILATTGIIGLMAYGNLLYAIVKISFKKMHAGGAIIIALYGGLLLNSLVINSLFYTFIMLWMWTLVGFIDRD